MDSIISGMFSLVLRTVRDNTAKKLNRGDMTDEKFRQLIVRELDDIKTKLDGLARKDLLSSVSFLKDGLTVLNLALNESIDVCNISFPEEATMMGPGRSLLFNKARSLALSKEIRKLNIASGQRFACAVRSFQDANKKATEAFSNEALNTEDRIMATKLRVMSRIFESLEDPDIAAASCKLYLEELHRMPAVQEMFSVQLGAAGMKSRLNKTKRLENVMSVTMINFVVLDFTKTFTKTPTDFLDWPKIDTGKRIYHPAIVTGEILTKVKESGAQPHNQFTSIEICSSISAVNSKGEIFTKLAKDNDTDVVKITAGQTQLFCNLKQKDSGESNSFHILSLAIDGEDNVYVFTTYKLTADTYHFKLFVFDANGNMKHQSELEFLGGKYDNSYSCTIAVTKDKKIIIHKSGDGHVCVCDRGGELVYSFRTNLSHGNILSISNDDEIIAAQEVSKCVYICTEEGMVKRSFEVPEDHWLRDVAFNHVTKEIIVLTNFRHDLKNFYLLSYSETGEQRKTLQLPFEFKSLVLSLNSSLVSHPSGPVALVNPHDVLYIQY